MNNGVKNHISQFSSNFSLEGSVNKQGSAESMRKVLETQNSFDLDYGSINFDPIMSKTFTNSNTGSKNRKMKVLFAETHN